MTDIATDAPPSPPQDNQPAAPPSLAAAVAREAAGDRAGADAMFAALYDQQAPDPAMLIAWSRLRRRAGDTQNAAKMLDVAARAGGGVPALIDMAAMLIDQGQIEPAEKILRQAAASGRTVALDYEVARWEAARRNLPTAAALFRGVIKAEPNNLSARLGLARTLVNMGQGAEAEGAYSALLKRDQNNIQIANELAYLYMMQGRFALAQALYDRIGETGVDMVREYAQLAGAMMNAADWSLRDELTQKLAARMDGGKPGMFDTMPLLASVDDPALHRRMAENFANALNILSQRVQHPAARGVGPADRRLRIGYLCGDFNQSTIALLFAGVLEAHDRTRFEIFAYDYSVDDQSPLRARVVAACEHMVDLGSEPPLASAARIAADEIDILVDLKGYSDRTRTEILALRPAPVQVSFLNYPASLGGDWADYIIADRIVFPPELQPHFPEKAVRMPASYLPSDRSRPLPAPDTARAAQGLPETGTVFACFTTPNRITPAIFGAWMDILKATEGSVLWLFQGNDVAGANLRAQATAAGVDPARLVFTRPATHEQHTARHACADLFLDTAPFGTGSMVADALWTGLPVITCMGNSFASRTGASLLHAVDLPELVTADLPAYVSLATQLAADPARLASLRARLEAARHTSPLFDAPAFARGLEQAFTTMAETQRSGAAPAPIDVTI